MLRCMAKRMTDSALNYMSGSTSDTLANTGYTVTQVNCDAGMHVFSVFASKQFAISECNNNACQKTLSETLPNNMPGSLMNRMSASVARHVPDRTSNSLPYNSAENTPRRMPERFPQHHTYMGILSVGRKKWQNTSPLESQKTCSNMSDKMSNTEMFLSVRGELIEIGRK